MKQLQLWCSIGLWRRAKAAFSHRFAHRVEAPEVIDRFAAIVGVFPPFAIDQKSILVQPRRQLQRDPPDAIHALGHRLQLPIAEGPGDGNRCSTGCHKAKGGGLLRGGGDVMAGGGAAQHFLGSGTGVGYDPLRRFVCVL